MTMPTILVVDDHDGFRSYARVFLEASGFDVVGEAADGASAISEVRRLRPEIVMLDVALPDIDGFAVTLALLAEPGPPRIVLVSTREAADYGSALVLSGARGFLTKSQLTGAAVWDLVR